MTLAGEGGPQPLGGGRESRRVRAARAGPAAAGLARRAGLVRAARRAGLAGLAGLGQGGLPGPFVDLGGGVERIDRRAQVQAGAAAEAPYRALLVAPAQSVEDPPRLPAPRADQRLGVRFTAAQADVDDGARIGRQQIESREAARVVERRPLLPRRVQRSHRRQRTTDRWRRSFGPAGRSGRRAGQRRRASISDRSRPKEEHRSWRRCP